MPSSTSLDAITHHHLVPVLVVDNAAHAPLLARALLDGGLPVGEVTLRTDAALASITAMAQEPDLLVGAGTVLTAADVDAACDAGASYLVSPGLSKDVIDRAREREVPILPGAATATEVQTALAWGIDTVKFFPAETSGGVAAVKALSQAFRNVSFVPTGGITAATAPSYLALPAVRAVGGSWMAPRDLLEAQDLPALTSHIAHAVAAVAEA